MIVFIIILAVAIVIYSLIKTVTKKQANINQLTVDNIEPISENKVIEEKPKRVSQEEIQAAKEAYLKKKSETIQENNMNEYEVYESDKEMSVVDLYNSGKIPEGYFYHEMVGMYYRGITEKDFGVYEGVAVAETNNSNDKFAVGIYRKKDNKLIGYVPKEERGISNEILHRKIRYNGGSVKAFFKIQGSTSRSYGAVYIKEGNKVFRDGNEKSPYKSKTTKEFNLENTEVSSGKYKCYIKIGNSSDKYDYSVSAFNELGQIIGRTSNNELQLFDYVEEKGNNVLAWCKINAETKQGVLYVPLNLADKTVNKKLEDFLNGVQL